MQNDTYKKILWLEDNFYSIMSYVEVLSLEYGVDGRRTITDARLAIEKNRYDLFIMDIMVPTKNEEEERSFPPEITEKGRKTGLIFYRREKERLDRQGTKVLALTVSSDENLRREFLEAGLPEGSFATKYALREIPVFLAKIRDILEERRRDAK